MFKDFRKHRGRRRLSVRTCDGQHVAISQCVFRKPLRPRYVWQPAIENRFHQRIATRNDVANDPYIRCDRKLISTIAFDHANTGGEQLIAHRRIHV